MNCYIPSGHLLLPAKATGVDKLRPLHKELGSALNVGITMATMTALPGITTTSVPEWLAFQKGEQATDS